MGTRLATSAFGQFMASASGRILRVSIGIAMLGVGWYVGDTTGNVIAAIGLVPLVAGAFDICLFTGLLGGLWTGDSVRRASINRAR